MKNQRCFSFLNLLQLQPFFCFSLAMASSLLSPSLFTSTFPRSSGTTRFSAGSWRRRSKLFVIRAEENQKSDGKSKDDDTPAFNPFGFVTDNPSSRSAIQLPESPAEDGNVGQMLYVSEFRYCCSVDTILFLSSTFEKKKKFTSLSV